MEFVAIAIARQQHHKHVSVGSSVFCVACAKVYDETPWAKQFSHELFVRQSSAGKDMITEGKKSPLL
jgi:hypothetical protein